MDSITDKYRIAAEEARRIEKARLLAVSDKDAMTKLSAQEQYSRNRYLREEEASKYVASRQSQVPVNTNVKTYIEYRSD